MSQESFGSKNEVDVGVNCKNKIPQNFLKPTELHKLILQVSFIFEL